jgi:hypothetical protein
MLMMTFILVRHGHHLFRAGVLALLAIALVALVVACWPWKSDSK